MSYSPEYITDFIARHYAISGNVQPLVGFDNQNFKVTADDASTYIFKINSVESKDVLEMQHAIMDYLSRQNLTFQTPYSILSENDQYILKDKADPHTRFRLLSWLPGKLWADVNPHNEALMAGLGNACGQLCAALQKFWHPGTERHMQWDLAKVLWIKEKQTALKNPEQQKLIEYFVSLYDRKVAPLLPSLRKSVIHNDLNDYNLLVNGRHPDTMQLSGIFDFGDAVFSHTINELAVAAAYALMDKTDPVQAALPMIAAFHKTFPLQENELEVLFPLIAMRLCLSVTTSAINVSKLEGNKYLGISEIAAWKLLQQLRMVHPSFAAYNFRYACEMEACTFRPAYDQWFGNNKNEIGNLIGGSTPIQQAAWLDLSVGSKALGHSSRVESYTAMQQTIDEILEEAGTTCGVGGYGEYRSWYSTDAYQQEGNEGPQWRTRHLGLDIWLPAGTPVFAPLDGIIYSIQNNEGDRNYGPTIILQHQFETLTFYTLYGHLSTATLDRWKEGKKVQKGELLATFGDPSENGHWPPHLHFQIMLDTLGWKGDFPGVAFPNESEVWLSICPNPADWLDLPSQENVKPSVQQLLDYRHQHLGYNLSLSYKQPLYIVRGYMQYLYNQRGRRYLDTVNNVPHVGHQHPRILRAAQKQMALLNTNTRYLHDEIIAFANELLATLPDELSICYFVNSGSEANELALRMAKCWSAAKDMIVVENGYHGNTNACVEISSYKFDGKGGKGAPAHTHVVPMPDTYRGEFKNDDSEAGKKYAHYVQKAVQQIDSAGKKVAGFICESILSCGGQILLPDGYLKNAFSHIREAGGLCIADEVQVGLGRVGRHFWGFELQGVTPDIVTIGKPLGNGHPLGAVVTSPAVAKAFANGMEYFNTFGGNPVSCAIGREVLRVVKEEALQEHALEVGNLLKNELKNLQKNHPIIGDVRGEGLFLGLELVQGAELNPAAAQAGYLINRMQQFGMLMSTDGPLHNVIKIKPPMCFSESNALDLIERMDKVLREDYF